MTTTTLAQVHHINATGARRRQLRMVFAGAAAIALLALFDAARADTTQTMLRSGSLRLTDMAVDLPAPAGSPFGLPQTPPGVVSNGGLAADGDDDQAQQQEQQALQQMQQAEQQAEQQNEQAQLQAQQAEQQGQWVGEHPGP